MNARCAKVRFSLRSFGMFAAAAILLGAMVFAPGALAFDGEPADAAADNKSAPEAAKKEPPQIILMGRAPQWITFQEGRHASSQLRHEYVRQSFLMAARHDYGLSTRDEALGESVADKTPHHRMRFHAHPGDYGQPNMVSLIKVTGFLQRKLGEWEVSRGGIWHYRDSVIELQNDARVKFVGGLKTLRYEPRSREINQEAKVPDDVRKLMREMNIFSQYEAVRRLHQEMDEHGDADELLLAISRAYAHLGLLTEHHWSASHVIFKARAVLYGERLSARHRNLPDGYAVRGYALALAGCHRHAQEDMETAGAVRGGREPHEWEKLIGAFIRYDLKNIDVPRDSDLWQLAQVMKCVACEQSGSAVQTANVVRQVFEENENLRHCERLHAILCDATDVHDGDAATRAAASTFAVSLYDRLAQIPGLPDSVKEIVEQGRQANDKATVFPWGSEPKIRRELMARLEPAGGAPREDGAIDEFSLAILGKLIADESYVQVAKRVDFEREKAHRAPDPTVDAAQDLLANHPMRPVLDGLCWNRERRLAAARRFRQWPIAAFEPQQMLLMEAIRDSDPESYRGMMSMLSNSCDQNACTLPKLLYQITPQTRPPIADNLDRVSPHSPWVKAIRLEAGGAQHLDHVKGWEPIAEQHAVLALAVARFYQTRNRPDDSERMYRAALKIAPSFDATFELAEVYRAKKDWDKWSATLDECLKFPEHGGNHARVYLLLARHHWRNRNYEEALRRAELAVELRSPEAMEIAAYCCEALGKFEEAEQLFRELSEHGGIHATDWALFCRRTGFGDWAAAKEQLEQFVLERLQEEGGDVHELVGRAYLLLDQPGEAIRIFRRSFELNANPYIGLLGAVTADREGNKQARDELLRGISRRSQHFRAPEGHGRPEMIELAAYFADDLANGGNAEFNLKEIEALVIKQGHRERFGSAYILAEYLELHGKREEAVAWHARCADPLQATFCQPLAGMRLVNRGIDAKGFAQHVDRTKDAEWLRE